VNDRGADRVQARRRHLPATITVAQASELTGLSIRATYRTVEAGHIPHFRYGQRILNQTAKF
jgi:excisionase family DNA binding protein